ncbi:GGDEF domain-containing protein, partial [Aquabacterium sp.]|uniref:GGDEF domain-containing protein n=1 Tax=Aquabacterium sp. TaxID=1872578 RepID=UPI0025C5F42D
AGVTHMAFGLLFYQALVEPMMWVNVGSVLTYVLAAALLRQDRVGAAMFLMIAEVAAHAILAVVAVGWESGFHYYLLIAIPVYLANQVNKWPFKIAFAGSIAAAYLLLDWYWRQAPPHFVMSPDTLAYLHRFNLATTIALLSGLTVLYVHLITQAEERLHELATTDSLTGLMNRRSILVALEHEQALRERKPHPCAVLIVDIDHFKRINDTYGHNMGDWALQAVADVLKIGVRDMDFVARWGGEEFLIILPFADTQTALPVAERLRLGIADLRIPTKDAEITITATLGLTELRAKEPSDTAIQRADVALYKGKHAGRNQVVVNPI